MGKDLRGKELGVGISQRKDGLYTARFTDRYGKRQQKYFEKLQDCRKWLADAQFEDEHGNALRNENPTVDAWYGYWIDNVKGNNVRHGTRVYYERVYKNYIKPDIGNLLIRDVRPMHCQNFLNQMESSYSVSTVHNARLVIQMMFDSAAENGLISKNPITRNVRCGGRKPKDARVLTVAEQKMFLENMKESAMYNQYALVLQTGLRAGEVAGLRWQDVDFDNRLIHVRRTMYYCTSAKRWITNDPKTKCGIRDIPLTQEVISLLKNQKEKLRSLKVRPIEFADHVFLSRNGQPVSDFACNRAIHKFCRKAGIPKFSMHTLRHTFATRCIEGGMRPKTLQTILGHSNIDITMNLYVHVTDETKEAEMRNIEHMLKVI